jgi:hypothetical protein
VILLSSNVAFAQDSKLTALTSDKIMSHMSSVFFSNLSQIEYEIKNDAIKIYQDSNFLNRIDKSNIDSIFTYQYYQDIFGTGKEFHLVTEQYSLRDVNEVRFSNNFLAFYGHCPSCDLSRRALDTARLFFYLPISELKLIKASEVRFYFYEYLYSYGFNRLGLRNSGKVLDSLFINNTFFKFMNFNQNINLDSSLPSYFNPEINEFVYTYKVGGANFKYQFKIMSCGFSVLSSEEALNTISIPLSYRLMKTRKFKKVVGNLESQLISLIIKNRIENIE